MPARPSHNGHALPGGPNCAAIPVLVLLAAAACTGPTLRIQNPEQHELFVDGRLVAGEPSARDTAAAAAQGPELPFRYYGTTRIDALPRIRSESGIPRVDYEPTDLSVEVSPPASLWLFPLDFAVELAARAIHGRPDQTAVVKAPAIRDEQRLMVEIPQSELGKLSARGRAARIER